MKFSDALQELKRTFVEPLIHWWLTEFSSDRRAQRALRRFVTNYYASNLALEDGAVGRWVQGWRAEVRGECVLNIGCGPQFFDDAVSFGVMPREVVGTDINEANIAFLQTSTHPHLLRSKRELEAQNVKVDLLVHDIRSAHEAFLGRFDTIFASGVMGIFDADELTNVVQLLYSYLAPKGTLVLVSYYEAFYSKAHLADLQEFHWASSADTGRDMVARVLQDAGFTLLKSDTFTVPNPRRIGWRLVYGIMAQK